MAELEEIAEPEIVGPGLGDFSRSIREYMRNLCESLLETWDAKTEIRKTVPKIQILEIQPPPEIYNPPQVSPVTVTLAEKYKVTFDVSDFSRSDLKIIISDKKISVTGVREMESENGYEYREIHKILHIPKNVDIDTLTAHFTFDAMLVIEGSLTHLTEKPLDVTDEAEEDDLSAIVASYKELMK